MNTSNRSMPTEIPEAYWTAVANIIRERPFGPGGVEKRIGTKHFAPGAKVYIIDWYAGMCERIIVVGMHRKSKRFIRLVIDVKTVENPRPKLCYTPAAIRKIKEHYSANRISWLTEEFVTRMCEVIPYWQAELKKGAEAFRTTPDSVAAPEVQQDQSFLSRLWIDLMFLLRKRG